MLRVKDCMDTDPRVVTPQASLREAISKMLAEDADGLAVVDDKNHCLGLITLGYLLRGFMPDHLTELSAAMQDEVEQVNITAFFGPTSFLFLVADFFKDDAVALNPDDSLMDAAASMERQMLPMLPVVKGSKLVGVLSRREIMQAFYSRSTSIPVESVE